MSLSKPNASAATVTTTRVAPSPISGLCVSCVDGCPGYCEVGRSALRGREVIYPQPFGKVTAGSEKNYPVDFSRLMALTREAADVSGIPYVMEADMEEGEKILS